MDLAAIVQSIFKLVATAAISELGILALLVIVVSGLAWKLLNDPRLRVFVFVMMFIAAVCFGAAMMLQREPVLAGLTRTETNPAPAPSMQTKRADASKTVILDAECVDARLAKLRDRQNFSQDGGVGCASAGLSGNGQQRNDAVTYQAPRGFGIVGEVRISPLSNIDGSHGNVQYRQEAGLVVAASVAVSCRSENRIFGAGASMRIRLEGSIERPVSDSSRETVMRECSQPSASVLRERFSDRPITPSHSFAHSWRHLLGAVASDLRS